METVYEFVEARARKHAGHDAIVFCDTRTTYEQLLSEADRAAPGLSAMGVRPGDRVGHLYTYTARQLMIVEGTSQVQRLVIARAMIQSDINYW